MRETIITYNSPSEWLKNNRKRLSPFAGEWIAFTNIGVIAHDKNGRITAQKAKITTTDYVLKYVHPLEILRIIRIVPIRIK